MFVRKLLVFLTLALASAGSAHADLDITLRDLNVSAKADLGDFRADLGASFGSSGAQVDLVLRSVDQPADAAVCLWLAKEARQPVETVLRAYRSHKGQGWGSLAKSLGIKPGSSAFHALKKGELGMRTSAGAKKTGKDKGKGKGRS